MSLRVKNSGKITATQKDKAGGIYVKYPKSTNNEFENVIQPVENLKYKALVIEGVSTDNNGNMLYGAHSLNPDSTIVDMYSQDKVGQWGGQSSAYGVQINSLINGTLVGTKYRYSVGFPNVPDTSGTYVKYPQGSGNIFIGNNGLNIFTNGFVLHFDVNTTTNMNQVYTKVDEKITFTGSWTTYIEITVESNNILSAKGFTDITFTDQKWAIPRLFAIYGDEPENITAMTVIPTSNYSTGWSKDETQHLRLMEFGILE